MGIKTFHSYVSVKNMSDQSYFNGIWVGQRLRSKLRISQALSSFHCPNAMTLKGLFGASAVGTHNSFYTAPSEIYGPHVFNMPER